MPTTIDASAFVLVGQLDAVARRFKQELDAVASANAANAFQSVAIENGQVKFYATTDQTGDVVGSFDLPEEIFLDQASTSLVSNFTWSVATYPGSTNPNLNGKTVLVLGVKGDKTTNPTIKYSFVNLESLIDTYTAADNSINISGYTVGVKISAAANNAITLNNDGLHVDISGKVDKVANAAQGEIAIFGASGAIVAGGLSIADIQAGGSSYAVATSLESGLMSAADKQKLDSFNFADDADVYSLLTGVFGAGDRELIGAGDAAGLCKERFRHFFGEHGFHAPSLVSGDDGKLRNAVFPTALEQILQRCLLIRVESHGECADAFEWHIQIGTPLGKEAVALYVHPRLHRTGRAAISLQIYYQ